VRWNGTHFSRNYTLSNTSKKSKTHTVWYRSGSIEEYVYIMLSSNIDIAIYRNCRYWSARYDTIRYTAIFNISTRHYLLAPLNCLWSTSPSSCHPHIYLIACYPLYRIFIRISCQCSFRFFACLVDTGRIIGPNRTHNGSNDVLLFSELGAYEFTLTGSSAVV